jgi:hypothetical protein
MDQDKSNLKKKILKAVGLGLFDLAGLCFIGINALTAYTSIKLEKPFQGRSYQNICFEDDYEEILPLESYVFVYGEYQFQGFMTLKAPDKDLEITLINMTHVGDQRFYNQVFEIYQKHDIILYESVDVFHISEENKNHPAVEYLARYGEILSEEAEERDLNVQNESGIFQPESVGTLEDAVVSEEIYEKNDQGTEKTYSSDEIYKPGETIILKENFSSPIYVHGDGDMDTIIDFISSPLEERYWYFYDKKLPLTKFYSAAYNGYNSPFYAQYALVCSRNPILEDNIMEIYDLMEESESLSVAVPWGALHGPDIIRRLVKDHGFTLESRGYLLATYGNE